MPQIKPQAQGEQAAEPYGAAQNDNSKTFQERLLERFAPHEWVDVVNIDDETFRWQYMPDHEEEFEFTPDPMKITRRGQPEMWEIAPGQTERIVGANAYVMIDGLYKKLMAKKRIGETPNQEPTQARNFNFTDGSAQERIIDRILIGKATTPFVTNTEKDLGLEDATLSAAKTVIAGSASKKS